MKQTVRSEPITGMIPAVSVLMRYFRLLPSRFSFTTTLTLALLTKGSDGVNIPVGDCRRAGQSKLHPRRDTNRISSLVMGQMLPFRSHGEFVPVALILIVLGLVKIIHDINVYDFRLATPTVVLVSLTFRIIVLGLIADLVVSLHRS